MFDIMLKMPWAILLIILPLLTAMAVFVWSRIAQPLVLIFSLLMVIAVIGLTVQVGYQGVFEYSLGGWNAPLGIELYADGLSVIMLIATSLVGAACSVYASAYFNAEQAHRFWPIWLFLLAALNADPNIEIRLFNPFLNRKIRALGYLTDFPRLNRRMHNKSFTADNQVSVVGGRNVGDEYFEVGDGTQFVDLDALVAGQVVPEITADFNR